MAKVAPLYGRTGRAVANQYIISMPEGRWFQSYDSIVAIQYFGTGKVVLDRDTWDYSRTTTKYLAQFLGVTAQEIKKRVKSGQYTLAPLNI